jgi:hypothetical protein
MSGYCIEGIGCFSCDLPALESDPAAFWPAFEEWCRKTKWWWHFSGSGAEFSVECGMFRKAVPWRGEKSAPIETVGNSVTESGCRAWLSALEAIKERK